MTNNYTSDEIHNYADNIDNVKSLGEVNYVLFNKAIKFYVENEDRISFKKLIDKYKILVEFSSNEELKKGTKSFLEFLCSGVDNGFTRAWFLSKTKEKLEPGKALKMLREMYPLEEKQ